MSESPALGWDGGGRHLFERLAEEVARARRHGLPLACVLFRVREPEGCDEELRDRLAQAGTILARRIVRGSDVVATVGSGHFGIVANTSQEGAHVMAQCITRELESLEFTLEGREVRLEVGYGISAYGCGKTPRTLLEEARAALDIGNAAHHQIRGYS